MTDKPVAHIDLRISNRDLTIEELYRQKALAEMEEEWEALGGKTESGTAVDTSQEGLDEAAAGGQRMGGTRPGITSPLESGSEQVRDHAQRALEEGPVRKAVDTVLRTLAGMGADEAKAAVEKGTLPEKVSLKLLDPRGNISEALIRETLTQAGGLDAEAITDVTNKSVLALGMLMPGAGMGKAIKVGAESLALKAGKRAATATKPNVARVTAPDDVKAVMRAVSDIAVGKTPDATRVVTHAETIEKARRSGLTLEQAASMDVAKYDYSAIQLAVRDFHNSASTHLNDLIDRTLAGDAQAAAGLHSAFVLSGDLAIRDKQLRKLSGQTLESLKIMSEAERAPFSPDGLAQIAQLMKDAPEGDAMILAQRLKQLRKEEREAMAEQVVGTITSNPTWGDLVSFAWINNLVSGLITHGANIASSTATLAWAPAHRFLSATLDVDAYMGKGRSVFFGEAPAMLWGGVTALKESAILALRAAKTGKEQVFGAAKMDSRKPMPWPSKVWGEGPITNMLDWAYGLFTLGGAPIRGLMAEDTFYKWGAYKMDIGALAYREAALEGLSGKEFSRRVRALSANPPEPMQAKAQGFALIQTLNAELKDLGRVGQLGQGAQHIAEALGPVGKSILPFVRTPTNEFHMVTEYTPLLNALSDTLRADLRAKGPGAGERRAMAMGKVASSALIATAMATYGLQPIDPDEPVPYMTRITGAGPKDPGLRAMLYAQGWAPFSIHNPIDGKYYSMARLPIGTMLGATATSVEILGQLPGYQADQIAAAVVLGGTRTMINKTYLESLSNFFETMEGSASDARRFFEGLVRGTVPNAVRQFNRTINDPVMRETFTLMDHITSGIPGLSADLPPRRNLWGDPIMFGGGWGPDIASPIYTSPVKDDPVTQEIIRLKLGLTKIPKYVAGTKPDAVQLEEDEDLHDGVPLNPDEFDRLAVLVGKGGRAGTPNGVDLGPLASQPPLKDKIQGLMESANYQQRMTDSSRRDEIRRIVRIYKQAGLTQLRREYPDLDAAIRARMKERIQNKVPQRPQASGLEDLMKLIPRG